MSQLFTPKNIGNMVVPNRIVRSATGESMAAPDGAVTDELVRVYENLAKGGVGLIITGHTYVADSGKASKGMTGLQKDENVPGWRSIVDLVHGHGSKIVMQLNHAGRQTSADLAGETPLAPSAVLNKANDVTPREVSHEEVRQLIEAYGEAARRAKEAGFDGVQIHSAHGYLISQFISPYTNRREDEWGGSEENRAKFLMEVYRKMRGTLGDDYPLLIKLNAEDFIEGGLTVDMSVQIAKWLVAVGIEAIEISAGMAETASKIIRRHIKAPSAEAYFRPYCERFRKEVDVPLICVAGLRTREVMEQILDDDVADFVSLCRPLIREPDLPNKIKGGADGAECTSCNACTIKRKDGPLRCLAKPAD